MLRQLRRLDIPIMLLIGVKDGLGPYDTTACICFESATREFCRFHCWYYLRGNTRYSWSHEVDVMNGFVLRRATPMSQCLVAPYTKSQHFALPLVPGLARMWRRQHFEPRQPISTLYVL